MTHPSLITPENWFPSSSNNIPLQHAREKEIKLKIKNDTIFSYIFFNVTDNFYWWNQIVKHTLSLYMMTWD